MSVTLPQQAEIGPVITGGLSGTIASGTTQRVATGLPV